jgi:hypothetical protein
MNFSKFEILDLQNSFRNLNKKIEEEIRNEDMEFRANHSRDTLNSLLQYIPPVPTSLPPMDFTKENKLIWLDGLLLLVGAVLMYKIKEYLLL